MTHRAKISGAMPRDGGALRYLVELLKFSDDLKNIPDRLAFLVTRLTSAIG